MNRHWWIVLHKELRDALRDRRSLRTLALMTLLYPLLMWAALNNTIERKARSENEQIRIGVSGAAQAPQLLARLAQAGVTAEAVDASDEAALQRAVSGGRHAAIIRLPADFAERYAAQEPARLELWHDSVSARPGQLETVTAALQAYGRETSAARLTSQGLSLAHLSPVLVERFDIATPATRAGRHVAVLFGIFFLTVFYFGMDIAIDSSAGERERRSLEILLAQPIRGVDLIVGKWLAAAVFCAAGLALEFIAGHFMLQTLPLENIGMAWQVDAPELALLYLIALPLCLLAPRAANRHRAEFALVQGSTVFDDARTRRRIDPRVRAGPGAGAANLVVSRSTARGADPAARHGPRRRGQCSQRGDHHERFARARRGMHRVCRAPTGERALRDQCMRPGCTPRALPP